MTFYDPSLDFSGSSGGSSSDLMASQLSETRRRMYLIDQATRVAGQSTVDPNFAYQLAQQPIPDDQLVEQTMQATSMGQIEQQVEMLQSLPEDVAMGHWRGLSKAQQLQLQDAGYNPWQMTKATSNFDFFGMDVGTAGDAIGVPLRALAAGASAVGDVVSKGLHYLNVAGDFVPHVFRGTTEQDQSSERFQLMDEDLRNRVEEEQGRQFSDEEWRTASAPFWSRYEEEFYNRGSTGQEASITMQQFVQQGGNGRVDPNLEARIIELGNELGSSEEYQTGLRNEWNRTANGNAYIPPAAQLEALESLDGNWDDLELAVQMASGETAETLAAEKAEPGTPEYYQYYKKYIIRTQGDPRLIEAATQLGWDKVTVGRTVMEAVGMEPTAPGDMDSWFGLTSGLIDAAVMVFADPTLAAGKLNKAQRLARVGLSSIDDAAVAGERAIAVAALDGRIGREVADAGVLSQLEEALSSANPYVRLRAMDQRHIGRRNWRAFESFSEAFQMLDGNVTGSIARDFLARNPGVSHGFSAMIDPHTTLRAVDGVGLSQPERVARFFGSPEVSGQMEVGWNALTGGKMSRYFRQEVMLPQQTVLQRRGLTIRHGARATTDELVRAANLRRSGDLRVLRRKPVTQVDDDIIEATGRLVEEETWGRRMAELGIRLPVAGRLMGWAARTGDALGTHIPLRRGFQLSGADYVEETRKYMALGRAMGMSPDRVDEYMRRAFGAATVNPLGTLRDQAIRHGFEVEQADALVRQVRRTDDGIFDVRSTLDDLVAMAANPEDAEKLRTMSALIGDGRGAVNIAGRREIFKQFTREMLQTAGLDATDKGKRQLDELISHFDNGHYSVSGLDTVMINGQGVHVGVLPMADFSGAMALPQFRDLLYATRQESLFGRVRGITQNPFADAFMTNVWKPSVVLRLGFVPRAAGEEILSFVLREGPWAFAQKHAYLAAVREDYQQLALLKPVSWGAGIPGRTFRKLQRSVPKRRAEFLEDLVRDFNKGDEAVSYAHRMEQNLAELQDVTALAEIHAGISNSVRRWWTYNDWSTRRRFGSDGKTVREMTVPYVKGWRDVANAQMRVAEMGPIELLANFAVGAASKYIRRGLAYSLDDRLLYAARQMLHDPVSQRSWAGIISGQSMVMPASDLAGSEAMQLELLRDQSGVPIVKFDFEIAENSSGFQEWRRIPEGTTDLDTALPYMNEVKRNFNDLIVSDHLVPAAEGFMSADQLEQFIRLTNGTSLTLEPHDLLLGVDDEFRLSVEDRLRGIGQRSPFTESGELTDWVVQDYEQLLDLARMEIRRNNQLADEALDALVDIGPHVRAARGELDFHLTGVVDEGQLQRILLRAIKLSDDPIERRRLQDAVNLINGREWGTVGRRDEVLREGEEEALRVGQEAEDYFANPNNVARAQLRNQLEDAEPVSMQVLMDAIVRPNTADTEFVYRVVSEEDWQRIRQQGFLDTDGRYNIEGGTEVFAGPMPDLSYAATLPEGARVLRITKRPEHGWTQVADLPEETRPFADDADLIAVGEQPVSVDDIVASDVFVFDVHDPDEIWSRAEPPTDDMIRMVPGTGSSASARPLPPETGAPDLVDTEVAAQGEELAGMLPHPVPEGVPLMDTEAARRRAMDAIQSRRLPGAPGTFKAAKDIDVLDGEVQSILDRLLPGWDNEATDVSSWFRGRSDEVVPGPRTTKAITNQSVREAVERVRRHVAAMPPDARDALFRLIQGDHNLAIGQRAGRSWKDAIADLIDNPQQHVELDDLRAYYQGLAGEEASLVEETLQVLYDLDPHTAYLLLDETVPVWTGSAADLDAKLMAATKRGLADPAISLTGNEMWLANNLADGTPRAHPVSTDYRRVTTLLGDESFLATLRTMADDPDGLVRALRQSGRGLPTDEETLLRRILENLLDDEYVTAMGGFRKGLGGSRLVPLSDVVSDDYDLVMRLNHRLAEVVDNEALGAGGPAITLHAPGYVDLPRVTRTGSPIELGMEELTPGVHKAPPILLGNARSYSRNGPYRVDGGVRVDGASDEAILDGQARAIVDKFTEMFGTPDGSFLHNIIGPAKRHELSLDTIRETPARLLPSRFIAPKYAVRPHQNLWTRMVRKGFEDVVSPAISVAIRQPMYLHHFAKALDQLEPIRQLLSDPRLEAVAANLVANSEVESIDELEQLLHNLPAEIWDQGQSLIDVATFRAARTRMDDPVGLELFGNFTFIDEAVHEGRRRPVQQMVKQVKADPDRFFDDLTYTLTHPDDLTHTTVIVDRDAAGVFWREASQEAKQRAVGRLADIGLDPERTLGWIEEQSGLTGFIQWLAEREVARVRWQKALDAKAVVRGGDIGSEAAARIDSLTDRLGLFRSYSNDFGTETRKLIDEATEVRAELIDRMKRRAGSSRASDDGWAELLDRADQLDRRVTALNREIDGQMVDVLALRQMGPDLRRLTKSEDPLARFPLLDNKVRRRKPLHRRGVRRRPGDKGDQRPRHDLLGEVDGTTMAQLRDWHKRRENIQGYIRQEANNQAFANMIPFIDDSNIRSQFSEHVYNLMPFYFAQEQFLRRWARTFIQTPEAIRKMQLGYQGIQHSGMVQRDEFGNEYFVYPMPEAVSEWLASTPVLNHMFGDSGRVPNVLEFTGQIKYAMPGMDDPFGVPSLGPLGAIPLGMLANHFQELEPVENFLLSERGQDRDLLEQLVPAWAVQTYRAVTNGEDFQQQLASTTIRAMAALQSEADGLRLDAEEAELEGNLDEARELRERADEYAPGDGATAEMVEAWIDRVKQYARRQLLVKGMLATTVPASPQLTDVESLRPEFREMLEHLPFEQAVQQFLALNPDGLPFTISATDNPSMAQVPANAATEAWLDENADLIETFPLAGPWLMPTSDSSNTFHRQAWADMQAAGIRVAKTPEQWYADLKFQAGAQVYFQSQEAYEQALAGTAPDDSAARQDIELRWQAWRNAYLSQHPLFAEQLTGENRTDKQAIIDQLGVAVRSGAFPETPQMEGIRVLVATYENYMDAYNSLIGDQRAEATDMRAALQAQLYAWAQQFLAARPEVSNLWYSVIQPLVGLRDFGPGDTARVGTSQTEEAAPQLGIDLMAGVV